MNKHIEIVKKWLANPDSVSQQELEDNADAAGAACWVALRNSVTEAAAWASIRAADNNVDRAKYWVEIYERLTK